MGLRIGSAFRVLGAVAPMTDVKRPTPNGSFIKTKNNEEHDCE